MAIKGLDKTVQVYNELEGVGRSCSLEQSYH
ncbi:unnamed protein product [Kuraishia capsulata CBS 1993]|uniref:Uncharacterized protein n=1 Tax=Kuraishia capsulata CBS 1993 TaxID=1382522 RepID=W6MNU1_9ASCO|nr:uncharacterized protein KUCA_T00002701001 [Kuraishia capsulata CBS 1993]CDK26727.1 unnamed protein product [Kuraishia capsulata CBS 1993]